MKLIDQIQQSFKSGNNLMKLIYVNIGIFLVIGLPTITAHLFGKELSLDYWLSAPASLPLLMSKPWTLITYMFFHIDIWHIFFNMVFLYWFGTLFIQFFNERLLLNVYILGGITGALVFIGAYNFFPVFMHDYIRSSLLGASAAAMAILISVAIMAPTFKIQLFIWPVQLKYLALATVAIDIFTINSSNPGGHISHLGGALFGLIFITYYKKGKDITKWMNPIWDFFSKLFTKKPRMKVSYKRPDSDFEFTKRKNDETKELDRILEKIKVGGYDNLTREEKEFLFKQSQD